MIRVRNELEQCVCVCARICVNMFGQELPSRPDTELTFTLFPTDAELVTENNKNSFNFAFVCLLRQRERERGRRD